MKRKNLRKLLSNATDELKTCDNTKKRWCEFINDIFLTKVFTTDKKGTESVILLQFDVFP